MSPAPARRPLQTAMGFRSRAVLVVTAAAALLAGVPLVSASAGTTPAALGAAPQAVHTNVRAVADLSCGLVGRLKVCSHGDDSRLHSTTAAGEGTGSPTSTSSTRIGCYGDGHTGARIQAVYARPSTASDRLTTLLPSFRGWAGALEKAVDDSAHQTGGARHVRFATRPSGTGCTLDVISLALPAGAFSSLTATISALQQAGLDAKGTKYLIWSEGTGYCGIASMYDDAGAASSNLNNGANPTYARIDHRCWGYAEAHEVVHMLGGVQKSAPHATAGFHCRDGRDLMCYDDGSAGSRQQSVCGTSQAELLDCRHDDYFSTATVRGSWLSSHWNVAASAFLSPDWSDPQPGAVAPSPTTEDSGSGGDSGGASQQGPLPSLPPLVG